MTCFNILLDGSLRPGERVRRQVAGSRTIAADGGMRHANVLGLDVELWVGDFDSTDQSLMARYKGVARQTHPTAKGRSDGELAVSEALKRGASRFMLVGGLGGKTDHTLATIMQGLDLEKRGISVILTSGEEEAYPLLPGMRELDVPSASRLSVIALVDLVGLSLSGVEWPLRDHAVAVGSSLTISNTVVGPVRIELGGGYGVVVVYPG